ncbi:hypothetical protein HI914_05154 [Erysiphe necator]|nr:hypothetical protein HI914_05154 [Erysiphe necator]
MTSSFEFYTSNLDRHLQESSSQNLISAAEHHLLFASEYYLKPKGVDYVQKEFKCQLDLLDLQDSLVKFKYDPEKYNFLITCSPGKSHNVWKIFHAIMTKMVREECQKSIRLHKYEDSIESTDGDSSCDDEYECYDEDLVLESDKIGRVGICEAQAQQLNLSVPSPICISTFSNISNQVDDQNFKYTYCWEDRVLKINDVFTDSVLQELSSLTGCTFIKEPNDCRIYIKSDLEASLNKGISKMDNIKNYFLPQNKIPVYHSFYTESEPNSQFAFLRISNSKNRIFKTTLIDNLSSKIGADEIKDLQDLIQDAVIIRYASFDRVSAAFQIRWKLKVVPIVKEEEKNLVSKSCRNPIYPLKDAHQEAHDLFGINQYKTRNSISRENHKEFVDIKKKLNLSSRNPQISNWVQDVVDSDSLKAEGEGIEPTTTKLKNPPGKKKGPTSYDLANRFKDAPQSTIRESPKNELVLKKLRSSLISSKDKTEKAPINPKVKFEQETPRDFWSRHPGKFSVDLTDIKVNQQQQRKSVDLRLVANKTQASNLIDDFIPELSCNIPKPKKE